jgi:hypothetical protein
MFSQMETSWCTSWAIINRIGVGEIKDADLSFDPSYLGTQNIQIMVDPDNLISERDDTSQTNFWAEIFNVVSP